MVDADNEEAGNVSDIGDEDEVEGPLEGEMDVNSNSDDDYFSDSLFM